MITPPGCSFSKRKKYPRDREDGKVNTKQKNDAKGVEKRKKSMNKSTHVSEESNGRKKERSRGAINRKSKEQRHKSCKCKVHRGDCIAVGPVQGEGGGVGS